nr:spore protease YyaC [Paenibacillus sp. Pae108]
MKNEFPASISREKTVYFCIGTDRATGDALGPLIGTELKKLGYHVLGTLDEPVHAINLNERLQEIPEGKIVIAIDACLGQPSSVGQYQVGKGPMNPGAGIGKRLTPVGDYHIKGIVNVGGFMEDFTLHSTRLSLVMKMAKDIVSAIQQVFQPALLEVAETADWKSTRI